MQLDEVWLEYCARRIPLTVPPGVEALSPEQVLADFWIFHPHFTGRMDAIKATPYSTSFDHEVDAALMEVAKTNSLDGWEKLTAGAWRVLYERLAYCEIVIAANWAQGTEITDHLPSGLAPNDRPRALLLRYLLGHGRTIDRRLLPLSPAGAVPPFPASTPIRRQ